MQRRAVLLALASAVLGLALAGWAVAGARWVLRAPQRALGRGRSGRVEAAATSTPRLHRPDPHAARSAA